MLKGMLNFDVKTNTITISRFVINYTRMGKQNEYLIYCINDSKKRNQLLLDT